MTTSPETAHAKAPPATDHAHFPKRHPQAHDDGLPIALQAGLHGTGRTPDKAVARGRLHLIPGRIEFAGGLVADAGPTRPAIPHSLDAKARVTRRPQSDVAAEAMLDTDLFGCKKAHEQPIWARQPSGLANEMPDTGAYGVRHHLCRARRRRVSDPIKAALNGKMPGAIRARGLCRIGPRPNRTAGVSRAGALRFVRPLGTGRAAVAKLRRGERWQEIAWTTLTARMNAALPPELPAPVPPWRRAEAAA